MAGFQERSISPAEMYDDQKLIGEVFLCRRKNGDFDILSAPMVGDRRRININPCKTAEVVTVKGEKYIVVGLERSVGSEKKLIYNFLNSRDGHACLGEPQGRTDYSRIAINAEGLPVGFVEGDETPHPIYYSSEAIPREPSTPTSGPTFNI